jgi:hypothetical protein
LFDVYCQLFGEKMLQKNLSVEQQGPIQKVEQISLPAAKLALGSGVQAFKAEQTWPKRTLQERNRQLAI